MEQYYAHDFPENALAFANVFMLLLKLETDSDISKEITDLTALTDGLKQLKVLKNKFRIRVPLKEYLEVYITTILLFFFLITVFTGTETLYKNIA